MRNDVGRENTLFGADDSGMRDGRLDEASDLLFLLVDEVDWGVYRGDGDHFYALKKTEVVSGLNNPA
jgi:hypothetical protein